MDNYLVSFIYPECCSLNNDELLLPNCLVHVYIAKEHTYHIKNPGFLLQAVNGHHPSTCFTLLSKFRLITFYNKLPTNVENIFSGAYIGNISKAYLIVDMVLCKKKFLQLRKVFTKVCLHVMSRQILNSVHEWIALSFIT